MKMKNSVLVVFALLIAASWGCNKQIEDKNTEKIDSLLAIVEADIKVMDALDSAEVARMRKIYNAYYDFFSNDYDDISNRDFYTSTLADMGECNKRLNNTALSIGVWKEELENAHKQLTTLRHDYSNGLLKEEEFEKYLFNEMVATARINEEVTENAGTVSMCLRKHKDNSAKLDSARTAWLAQQSE